jgi:fumarylpyruvate hydrolase
MSGHLFELPPVPSVPVRGSSRTYPVRRIFCVGRNYAAHAAEMGAVADRETPFYFTKSPSALQASGSTVPYPAGTDNYHHEMELVVALGAPVFRASRAQALAAVFGYACGLDMTRRDLQNTAKEKRHPWDIGKDVERSAVIAEIAPAAEFGEVGPQRIALAVNGAVRQDARLSEMIHGVPEIIMHLSGYYHLGPGDLIYTGTPAGVGAVSAGDTIEGSIDGLAPVRLTIGPAE